MDDERYNPGYLNKDEFERERRRTKEMVQTVTGKAGGSDLPGDMRPRHASMTCDIFDHMRRFLETEKVEIAGNQAKKRLHRIYISEVEEIEGLWYSFFKADSLEIEESSWVEIKSERSTLYGSLWYSEKRKEFYLITEEQLPTKNHEIREANEYQLILMQEEALKFSIEQQDERCKLLRNIICNNYSPIQKQPRSVDFLNHAFNQSQ